VLNLGRATLLLGLVLAVAGIGLSLWGALARDERFVTAGRRCVYALFAVLTVSFAVLEAAFVRSDFSFGLVATHSSTTTALFYKLTGAWSSQEGSLLLWVWLLSGWSSLGLAATRARLGAAAPYATAVLLAIAAFFLVLVNFLASPFPYLADAPAEGSGLQPLLRHPAMMIHPPALYSGYTLFLIPFAFAAGALISGRLDTTWIRAGRRFALLAWLLLGGGVLLGARWSWSELGWGGYWAWDPVENAALLPWLTGTALLHSVMLQERRGMLKAWNVSLALATGVLAVLGTFLVRSGILESIHAFGASTLGLPFLVFVAVLLFGSAALVIGRREALRAEHRLESLWSREAVFLLNNLLLVGLCFVILWGTFFPLLSEALTGRAASVGPPWFSRYTVPLAIALVLLSGLGPVIAWRRVTVANLRRSLAGPALAAAATAAALVTLSPAGRRPASLLMFCSVAFVLVAVAGEFWGGARARQASTGASLGVALMEVVARNRRRYGGYVVHAGVALMFVGVAASSAFPAVRDVRLAPGGRAEVGGYEVTYREATGAAAAEKLTLGAVLDVSRDGRHVATLRPSRGYYPVADPRAGPVGRYFEGESTSEVGLDSGLRHDLWTAVEPDVAALDSMIRGIDRRFPLATGDTERLLLEAVAERYRLRPPRASFRLLVAPLVAWVWLGGLLAIGGGLLAAWPGGLRLTLRRPQTALVARRRALERV
jgi:cytochrome c-type biogenesis protein CcmF